MELATKKTTRELDEAYRNAQREPIFSAEKFLREIVPLSEEYFIGEFLADNQGIIAVFPNGQKIRITAKTINT